jgi:hypothetical protein
VDIRSHLIQCPAGLGSRGNACSSHSFIRSAASAWLDSFTCSIVRSSRDSGEALSDLWRVIRQEGGSAAIWLPGGV